MLESVADRVAHIRDRIARSAARVGRDADEVKLLAVCKRQPFERIRAACDAGLELLGENTAQGMTDTAENLEREGRTVQWHFVGHLQRNKVNHVLKQRPWIQTIDSLRLASAVSQRADYEVPVLVEVNVGDEEQKAGVRPQNALELACAVAALPNISLRGLMAIPPRAADSRPHFDALRLLSESLQQTKEGKTATELSMGMSSDFEAAIECGATIVRIGTGLFGPRDS